jgi:hypothetical protein
MKKRRISLPEACQMVPDDLPDGAYFAMAHEIAGADHGEAVDDFDDRDKPKKAKKK